MEKGEYFKIISNIPIDHEVDFLEAEMKIAERDHFCKPQTFIRELRQTFDELESDILLKTAKRKEELEYDIKTAYDYSNKRSYDLGFDVLENETYEEYHKRETERRIRGWKSNLKKVSDDALKHIAILDYWHGKVNELERIIKMEHIIQNANNQEQQTDDPQIQFNHKRHDIDTTLFKTIFKHCQGYDMFNIDEVDFIERIERADLSYDILKENKKTRLKILIKMIAREKAISENWYTETVDNLGITKNELTKSQKDDFESELKVIIDEWRKTKKEYTGRIKSNIKALKPT